MTHGSLLRRAAIVALTAANLYLVPAAFLAEEGAAASFAGADGESQPLGEAVAAPGLVEPVTKERALDATATGAIVFIGAEEGDAVTAGEVIAEIDNADLKAQHDAAEARVAMRKAELERLTNGAREEERREAAAAVAEADVAVHLAKTTLDRRRSLAQSGVTSELTLDQARADLDAAQARHELMDQRLALINAPPRAEDVAIAGANLALAEADAAALAAAIEKTRLRSPINGVLLRRYKSLGETVSIDPPTPVAKVGDISRLRVRADVDESDVARVALGQPVTVTADAYGDRRFSGHVAKIGSELDAKQVKSEAANERLDTKVLQVLVDLDADVRLPVGLRVDVAFAALPLADPAAIPGE